MRAENAISRNRRMTWGAIALVWIGLLIAYRQQVALVLEAWETLPSHAHGYVVLAVVAYLVWTKRHAVAAVPLAPSMAGLAALVLSSAAAFAGEMVSAGVVVQFALVFMLQAAIWAVAGTRAFRVLFGPLSFLLFAVPFGHDILPTLMDWTANATVIGLRASGVPVFQEDRLFIIPSGSWSVVEACSGIRYLLTAFFVGSIFAYITYTRWYKRIAFIAFMLAISLLANWTRAYVIVMVAHLSNNQWGLGLSHLAFGWVIFAVTILVSFWVGVHWQDDVDTVEHLPFAGTPALRATLGMAVLAATGGIGSAIAAEHLLNLPPRPMPQIAFASLSDLRTVQPVLPTVAPHFVGASAIHNATYQFDTGEVSLTVAYYRNQRQGAELVNVHNVIEPSKVWTWRKSTRLVLQGTTAPEMRLDHYARRGAFAATASVYWVGGWTTTSDIVSKIYQAINLTSGRGDDGAMVVITATTAESPEASQRVVEEFVRSRFPALLQTLNVIRSEAVM